MPSRGYRKGIADGKEPLPRQFFARLSEAEHQTLTAEAASRHLTVSKLARTLIAAHLKRQRAELPQARGPSNAALRELCRIGNNLNQLAKQANTGLVAISEAELRACLAQVLIAVDRL